MKISNIEPARKLAQARDELQRFIQNLHSPELESIDGYIQFKGYRVPIDKYVPQEELIALISNSAQGKHTELTKDLKEMGVDL